MSRAALALLGALLLVAPGPAAAVEVAGVEFSDRVQVDGQSLPLRGYGLLRRFFIKGYAAALYLPEGVASKDVLDDVPKRLIIEYFRNIDASDFGKAGDELVSRNVGPETMAEIRPRLAEINALYRNIRPGDRYVLTYVPGKGTQLAMNGEVLGVIPGADFAAAYFAIWLGPEPLDAGLKSKLLGKT